MPSRPYISWSIDQLSEWFVQQKDNKEVLNAILLELEHRKTRAAAVLREKIETTLPTQAKTAKRAEDLPVRKSRSSRYSAFLSYSRADADIAKKLKNIVETSGLETWLDTAGLSPGDEWESVIRRALVQADTVVVAVTYNIKGSYVERELNVALDMKKPIIPAVFDDFIDTDDPLAAELRKRQFVDFRGKGGRSSAPRLIDAIKSRHMAPVLAMYSIKGGVGKTTISAHFSAYLCQRENKKVLLVDLDPQANLSVLLVRPKLIANKGLMGLAPSTTKENILAGLRQTNRSVYGVLQEAAGQPNFAKEDAQLERYIHRLSSEPNKGTLDIVAGDERVAAFVTQTADAKTLDRARAGFSRFIESCRKEYDCVVIDMNPSISQLTIIALGAATDIISPIKPDLFSLQSIDLLERMAAEHESAANGLGRVFVLNDPAQDRENLVRKKIEASMHKERLVPFDLASSRDFYANPSDAYNDQLTWMPAHGNWGPNPSPARKSLRSVSRDIAEKVGLLV